MQRRRLLLALAATLAHPALAAPLRRAEPAPGLPEGRITLGWRWLPGATWTYRFVTEREVGGSLTQRAEAWRYLVREVDGDGVATLEGRLVGFGGLGSEGGSGARLTRAEQRAIDRPIWLQIGMDGRTVGLEDVSFADALPHRLLGVGLPATPVDRSDTWPLPDLIRAFRVLVPLALEVETRSAARLLEVYAEGARTVTEIETTATLRTRAGPGVHLSGTVAWDASRGGLLRRTLQARFTPATPDPAQNPGTLRVLISRV